jgi:signal transduction histidine kinase
MDWLLAMMKDPSQRTARSVIALDVCQRSLRAAVQALAIVLASEDNARSAARQAQSDLAEAMRRQEEFVAVMVHDALTDLTVIKGWA